MKTKLYLALEQAIQKWADENCETNDWPIRYTGGQTTALMAKAAASVFDAVIEFQEYAERERLFE